MNFTLSTPILFVLFPFFMAILSGVFFQRRVLNLLLTSLTAITLALVAALLPESLSISIGPVSILFNESLGFLGRQIMLTHEILPFIAFSYAVTGLWLLFSTIPVVPEFFRSVSLVITALLTAAVGVEPFLYAALLIELAILVSILILSPAEEKTTGGILRYLSLQTMAMPFILLAGWLLTGVETLPPDSPLVTQSMIVLGLGIGLLLGVFPFHSWVPMISQQANPTVTSFIFFIINTSILVFGFNFLDRYTFLREFQSIDIFLRIFGSTMIIIGGIWTAFQDNLKRALGFSVLTEIGFSLLCVGLFDQGGLYWLFLLFPARAISLWLWGYSLTLIEQNSDSLTIQDLQGFARRFPILTLGLLVAQLSLAGLPLFASFPSKFTILTAVFESNPLMGIWSFFGNLGLFLFTFRTLSVLVTPNNDSTSQNWSINERRKAYLPILVIIFILILLGLFPDTFLANLTKTLTSFNQLQ